MTTYKISKGTAWAKPNATRLRFTRKGIEWRGRFYLGHHAIYLGDEIQAYGDRVPTPTTIKLVGLYPLSSALSPFGIWNRMRAAWEQGRWSVYYDEADEAKLNDWYFIKRGFRAALRQYASTTHTDSWRVLATWEERGGFGVGGANVGATTERGVALRLYIYDNARGEVFGNSSEIPHHGQVIAWLPEDPDKPGWTVEGEVRIEPRHHLRYVTNDEYRSAIRVSSQRAETIPLRRPWKYFGVSGSHANNGPGRRGAAVDLEWNAELEVL